MLDFRRQQQGSKRQEGTQRFSCGISDSIFISYLVQVLTRLALLVGVVACLNKLMVRDGEQKLVEVNRNAVLRLEHFRSARRLLWRSRTVLAGTVEPHRLR